MSRPAGLESGIVVQFDAVKHEAVGFDVDHAAQRLADGQRAADLVVQIDFETAGRVVAEEAVARHRCDVEPHILFGGLNGAGRKCQAHGAGEARVSLGFV